jgi:hypothetical protein
VGWGGRGEERIRDEVLSVSPPPPLKTRPRSPLSKHTGSEASYPYSGKNGKCMKASCTAVATITGAMEVPQNNDTALTLFITQQPVSVSVDAGGSTFQFYTSGVVTSKACGTDLDHAVLAVG